MPDFLNYHRSLTDELRSVKNRIRNLIANAHPPTDGEWKELALRHVLRRHVPNSVVVGRGFIVGEHQTSGQIDILIADGNSPTLFKDGDLMMVTPDAVLAIVEVKTRVVGPRHIESAVASLVDDAALCLNPERCTQVWTGLFAYESRQLYGGELLRTIGANARRTQCAVNCVSLGTDSFARYWDVGEGEAHPLWRHYRLQHVAPSYFIGNLVNALSDRGAPHRRGRSGYAWFPIEGGKEQYATYELRRDADEPTQLAGQQHDLPFEQPAANGGGGVEAPVAENGEGIL